MNLTHQKSRQKISFRIILSIGLVFALVTGNFGVYASVNGQTKVNLKMSNPTLHQLIWELEKKTGIVFVYSTSDLENIILPDINTQEETVNEILENSLKNTDLTFEIRNEGIVIKKTSEQEDPEEKITVSGVVKDRDGEFLPGVTVTLKGTTTGTATDLSGQFKLSIPANIKNPVIEFSFIGMKTQEAVFSGKPLDIILHDDVKEINEVVVTGIFQKRADSYTGAARTITAQELEQFKGRNLIATIANIDPAFNLMADNFSGSDPNRLPDVQIRGTSTLPADINDLKEENRNTQNTPLIVMDGFEISLEKMMDLNEYEIETITILKDAAASALYGSRASNGVIVITSKVPEQGKLRITYRGDLNIEMPDLSEYRLVNAAEKLELEKLRGFYQSHAVETNLQLQALYNQRWDDVNKGVNTDWLSKPLRTSYGQTHYLRLEGGSQDFRYSAGVRYANTPGVMKKSFRNNVQGDIVLSYNYKNVLFRNALNVITNNSSNSPYGSFSQYALMNPYFPTHDENGKLIKTYPFVREFIGGQKINPLYNSTVGSRDESEYMEFLNNFSIEWRPVTGLVTTGRISFRKNKSESHDFKPADHTSFLNYAGTDVVRRGSYILGSGGYTKYEMALTAAYSRLFSEKHQVDAGINVFISGTKSENVTSIAEGFPNPDLDFFGAAVVYQKYGRPSGTVSENRTVGFTGTANYYYDGRYFLEGSFRLDGDSRFGANHRFAPFWSAGVGWNMHNESFFANPYVDRLKLRLTYGVSGTNNFQVSQAQTTYRYDVSNRYGYLPGANIISMGNEDLKWQQTNELNIGLELAFLQNRYSLRLDVYNRETENLLTDMDISLTTGFPNYKENVGKMENNGFELSATTYVLRDTRKKLYWTLSGTLVHNKNKIVKISEALKEKNAEQISNLGTRPTNMYIEGKSPYTMYVVKSLGIDPATGKEIYQKNNGEPTYEWSNKYLVASGDSQPKYRGNLTSTLRYDKIMFTASFAYMWGGQRYNTTLLDKVENANMVNNVDRRVFHDRWKQPGDHTFFKGINETGTTNATSRFVQDENTFYCQNISLRYDLSSYKWVQKSLRLQQLNITASTNELFYLSTIKQERGINYPFARRFSFSLSAVF